MNKLLTTILLLLLSITIYCSSKNLDAELLDKVKKIETSQTKLNKTNDSLSKELLYYKIKEDYYAVALGAETTRFALIITGLLTLIGIAFGLSFWLYIPKKMDEFKIIMTEQDLKFQNLNSEFNKLLYDYNFIASDLYVLSSAITSEREGGNSLSFLYSIKAAMYSNMIDTIDSNNKNHPNLKRTNNNLNNAEEVLKKMGKDDIDKIYNKIVNDSLNSLNNSIFSEIKEKAEILSNKFKMTIENQNE